VNLGRRGKAQERRLSKGGGKGLDLRHILLGRNEQRRAASTVQGEKYAAERRGRKALRKKKERRNRLTTKGGSWTLEGHQCFELAGEGSVLLFRLYQKTRGGGGLSKEKISSINGNMRRGGTNRSSRDQSGVTSISAAEKLGPRKRGGTAPCRDTERKGT